MKSLILVSLTSLVVVISGCGSGGGGGGSTPQKPINPNAQPGQPGPAGQDQISGQPGIQPVQPQPAQQPAQPQSAQTAPQQTTQNGVSPQQPVVNNQTPSQQTSSGQSGSGQAQQSLPPPLPGASTTMQLNPVNQTTEAKKEERRQQIPQKKKEPGRAAEAHARSQQPTFKKQPQNTNVAPSQAPAQNSIQPANPAPNQITYRVTDIQTAPASQVVVQANYQPTDAQVAAVALQQTITSEPVASTVVERAQNPPAPPTGLKAEVEGDLPDDNVRLVDVNANKIFFYVTNVDKINQLLADPKNSQRPLIQGGNVLSAPANDESRCLLRPFESVTAFSVAENQEFSALDKDERPDKTEVGSNSVVFRFKGVNFPMKCVKSSLADFTLKDIRSALRGVMTVKIKKHNFLGHRY